MRLVLGGSNPWLHPFGIEQRAGAEICGQSSRHHSDRMSWYARCNFAKAVVFLVLDDSSFANGIEL